MLLHVANDTISSLGRWGPQFPVRAVIRTAGAEVTNSKEVVTFVFEVILGSDGCRAGGEGIYSLASRIGAAAA